MSTPWRIADDDKTVLRSISQAPCANVSKMQAARNHALTRPYTRVEYKVASLLAKWRKKDFAVKGRFENLVLKLQSAVAAGHQLLVRRERA